MKKEEDRRSDMQRMCMQGGGSERKSKRQTRVSLREMWA